MRKIWLIALLVVGCKDPLTTELHAYDEPPPATVEYAFDHSNRVFSCRERDEAGMITACIDVSLDVLGNDPTSIRRAHERCAGHEWQPGNPCPEEGVREACRGAALEDGVVYDKFLYAAGLENSHPLAPECAENGGNFALLGDLR